MMQGGNLSPVATRVLRLLRNVTLLERPALARSVVSAMQSAVRARERQYQIREQIERIRRGEYDPSIPRPVTWADYLGSSPDVVDVDSAGERPVR